MNLLKILKVFNYKIGLAFKRQDILNAQVKQELLQYIEEKDLRSEITALDLRI
jgi:hypothetical protein